MTKTKPVRIPVSLEEQFEKLPNKGDYGPSGFPEFVRQAVRFFLEREQNRSSMIHHEGILESEKGLKENL